MVIDCKQIANLIEEEIKPDAQRLKPRLGTIVVGSDEGTLSYMKSIKKVGERIGVLVDIINLSESKIDELIDLIKNLNLTADGILIGKPLPKWVDESKLVDTISPSKDIDCMHPVNLGRLFLNKPLFCPCTPEAVIEILNRSQIGVSGKDVVIIGRSDIVGKPLAIMLMQRGVDATITVCHTKTKDIEAHTKHADILIAAAGQPRFVNTQMVKEGAVVIDVGINVENGKIVGDVDFDEVSKIASWITPVPGGVGSVTSRVLMRNVVKAAKLRAKN
ncbi:MAG: bifunctional 5,10-methylenetetrahydrofolate dehydrogenase/5,10-methenyltetrahydrofolate cyclohydrolase [bacterium]|nr:bifunctional 5,10-methylenetetrahydrofolate dehydrogenase/5,10-methenyltetrahydrofolate cyclohydrolase [bacterium]